MYREKEQVNEDKQLNPLIPGGTGPQPPEGTGPLNAKQILELGRRHRPSLVSQARREEPADMQATEQGQGAENLRAGGADPDQAALGAPAHVGPGERGPDG